jgi:hypothetical protein
MTDGLPTPNEVVLQLAKLTRDLDGIVEQLRLADIDAIRKRHAADLAESHAFLDAEGSMDIRKHEARLKAADKEMDALVAEALVRHLRKKLDAVDKRIEVGRSMGTTVRAELKTLGYQEGA